MICCCFFCYIINNYHKPYLLEFCSTFGSFLDHPAIPKDAAGAFRGELGTLLQAGESGRCVAVPLICQGLNQLRSGKQPHNYGKIHHFWWVNQPPCFIWWFGTSEFYDFPETVGNWIIIPTDFHSIIFLRGRLKPPTNIQTGEIEHEDDMKKEVEHMPWWWFCRCIIVNFELLAKVGVSRS